MATAVYASTDRLAPEFELAGPIRGPRSRSGFGYYLVSLYINPRSQPRKHGQEGHGLGALRSGRPPPTPRRP